MDWQQLPLMDPGHLNLINFVIFKKFTNLFFKNKNNYFILLKQVANSKKAHFFFFILSITSY